MNTRRVLVAVLAFFAVSAFGQTGGKMTMKSGAVMEYQEAHVEGSEIVMKLPHGMMRLPASLISEESLLRIGGSPALFTAEPEPAPSPANLPAPVQASPTVAHLLQFETKISHIYSVEEGSKLKM